MRRESRRKNRGRESKGWVGPLFFPPIQSWPQAGHIQLFHLLFPLLPLLFLPLSPQKSFSESSFIYIQLIPEFSPCFLIIGFTSSVQSCMVVGINLLPSVHLLSRQTLPPTFLLHPHFFSLVRHHIRIYKSQLTTAHSPKTFFQVSPSCSATFYWSAKFEARKEKLKIQNTHTGRGANKRVWKEIRTGLVGFPEEERQKGAANPEGILVFTLKSLLSWFFYLRNLNGGSLAASLYDSLKKLTPALKLAPALAQTAERLTPRPKRQTDRAPAPLPLCTWMLYPNTLQLSC